jgi:hypothetical protein
VVGFAPGCGDGAVGEGAALVAGGEGGALGWGEEPGFAAEVEEFAVGAEEAGMMSASQAILRRVAAATGPVKTKFPVPVPVPLPPPVPAPMPTPVPGSVAVVAGSWFAAGPGGVGVLPVPLLRRPGSRPGSGSFQAPVSAPVVALWWWGRRSW